jgi:hypothetical protein
MARPVKTKMPGFPRQLPRPTPGGADACHLIWPAKFRNPTGRPSPGRTSLLPTSEPKPCIGRSSTQTSRRAILCPRKLGRTHEVVGRLR